MEFAMIASVLAFTLAAAAAAPDNTGSARKAYGACLDTFIIKGLDDKLEPDAFDTAVKAACTDKAEALRRAAVSAAVAAGRKSRDAEQMVAGDVEDYQINAKEMFREYKASNTKPLPR
jgi:hypothetical protein